MTIFRQAQSSTKTRCTSFSENLGFYTNTPILHQSVLKSVQQQKNRIIFSFTLPLRSYSFSGASVFSHSFTLRHRKLYQSSLSQYNEDNRRGRRGFDMSNLLSEVHPELVLEWSERNLPLTPDKITYGSNKIVWWIGTCGHEWQTSVKARSSGEKCPICSGARAVEGINDLVTLKPELAAEWSSKNNPLKPTMVTVGSHKKVIWKGKCGHEWTATVKSRAISGTGCPYCSHNKVLEGFNDLASQRPLIASEWSERNYPLKPNMVTVFANRKVWWKCSKGHESKVRRLFCKRKGIRA